MARQFCLLSGVLLLIFTVVSGSVQACVGARPLAMGGAFIAVADDANAVYWNPAGLVQLAGKSQSTSMLTLAGGINYQWFFASVERYDQVVVGVSGINKLDALDLDLDRNVDALLDNTWYQFSVALPLDENLTLGANLKFYQPQLYILDPRVGYTTQAAGMDIAIHWQASEQLRVGLLSQDITGSKFYYPIGYIPMATNVRPGIAYDLDEDTTVAMDIYDLTGRRQVSAGIEKRYEQGALRAGYYHNTWTAGFGLNAGQNFAFDYCYIYDSHLVSLRWNF